MENSLWFWVGFVFLAFYAWQNYNTWTEKEIGKHQYALTFKPRHCTIWPRFFLSSILYLSAMELLYVLLSYSPDAAVKMLGGNEALLKNFAENRGLASLLLITGISVRLPVLTHIEIFLRERLHERAFIPSEAEQVVENITKGQNIFRPDEGAISAVLQAMEDRRFSESDFGKPGMPAGGDDQYLRIRYRWCKLNYLKYKFEQWQGNSAARPVLTFCRPASVLLNDGVAALKSDIQLLIDKRQKLKEVEPEILERREQAVTERLDLLLQRIYTLISCSVHAAEKLPGRRSAAFKYFDLYIDTDAPAKIDWETVIRAVFAVFLPTLVATLFYFAFEAQILKEEMFQNYRTAFVWALLSSLLNAIGIGVAVLFHRKVGKAIMAPNGYGPARRPEESAAQMLGAGAISYLLGVLPLYLFAARRGGFGMDTLEKVWPWAFFPAVTAAFIIHYLNVSILSTDDGHPRLRQGRETAVQGTLTACIGAMAALMTKPQDVYFIAFATVTCGLIGAGIGYTFPEEYRRKVWRDRREHKRIDLSRDVVVRRGHEEITCRTINLSPGGVGLEVAGRLGADLPVFVEFPQVGPVTATVVREDGGSAYLRFHMNSSLERKMKDFVAQSAG